MSIPVNHHFLPQFYQRGWAGADGKVTEFRRRRGRLVVKRHFPSATGYGKELYAIESRTDLAARQEIETNLMSPVDNAAAKFLDHLRNRRGEMDPALGDAWAAFIVSMLHRSPVMIQKLKDQLKAREPGVLADVADLYQKLKGPNDPDSYAEYLAKEDPSRIPESFARLLSILVNSPRMRAALRSMTWAISTLGDGAADLMTGDSPIIMSNGIAYQTSFIIIPVSSKEFFIGAHRTDVIEAFRSQEPNVLAVGLNDAIVRQAAELVIAASDEARDFVDERLKKGVVPRNGTGRFGWKCPIVDLPDGDPLF